ncbi:MAG: TIGR03960 family B12-binding radical SAM protein [Dehalococcoidaceae bacterium]|nr:TIGR03960 family B12-binding radical SAM protein [Dehalococcoidaceae bacterium]
MPYPDKILRTVQKPARYTGGEWQSFVKNWGQTGIRVAVSYPDTYEVGMSNITIPILYQVVNELDWALAERVFAPWPDMERALRQAGVKLQSLESGHELREFDLVGFSLGYELTFTNVLNILDLGGIAPKSIDRGESEPLVMAGGIGALNPEPLSDFVDFFVIGDGEEALPRVLKAIHEGKKTKTPRRRILEALAGLEGVYVPSLYDVEYAGDGVFKHIVPSGSGARLPVKRLFCRQLPPPPTMPVVPLIETIQDRAAVEISRGCTRGCRFCNAGFYYRPLRHRRPDDIADTVSSLCANCGYDEVTLLSLSAGDYPGITGLIRRLGRDDLFKDITFSLPSLRVDAGSLDLVESLNEKRKSGLTLAPEAATERLQRVINKIIPEEEILRTAAAAFERGWVNLKLYFMLGLPTETDKDLEAIALLTHKVYDLGRLCPGRRPRLRLSLSTFVPKPHTPFQWVSQIPGNEIMRRVNVVRNLIDRRGISLSWQKPETSLLEAVFSRGDRRLGRAIYRAWELGARFDGWDELFEFELWRQAFNETGIDPAFYANREREITESLPWSHIDNGISAEFLQEEYRRALRGIVTPDCRVDDCNLCGLQMQINNCHNLSKTADESG